MYKNFCWYRRKISNETEMKSMFVMSQNKNILMEASAVLFAVRAHNVLFPCWCCEEKVKKNCEVRRAREEESVDKALSRNFHQLNKLNCFKKYWIRLSFRNIDPRNCQMTLEVKWICLLFIKFKIKIWNMSEKNFVSTQRKVQWNDIESIHRLRKSMMLGIYKQLLSLFCNMLRSLMFLVEIFTSSVCCRPHDIQIN